MPFNSINHAQNPIMYYLLAQYGHFSMLFTPVIVYYRKFSMQPSFEKCFRERKSVKRMCVITELFSQIIQNNSIIIEITIIVNQPNGLSNVFPF